MIPTDSKNKLGDQEGLSPLRPRRIAVTGGRDFDDADLVAAALQEHVHAGDTLVHGAARGADTLARLWAGANAIAVEAHPANWNKHGRAAGPIRNQEMADSGLDLLIAFPGGSGTAHLVRACRSAGVAVIFAGNPNETTTPLPGHLF